MKNIQSAIPDSSHVLPCSSCKFFINNSFSIVGSYPRIIFTFVLSTFVIILAIVHLVIEFFQILYSTSEYLTDYQNYIQVPLFLLSIVFVFIFPNQCGCPKDWQWQIGIFVVFLGWLNLIFFASKFPSTGVYVLVFRQISFTFFKLATFSIILVAAFSLVLFMMFSGPFAKVSY